MLRRDLALTDKANDIFRDDNVQAAKQPKLKISNLNPYINEIEVVYNSRRNVKNNAPTSNALKKSYMRAPPSHSESRKKVSPLSRRNFSSKDVNLYPKKLLNSLLFNT